MNKAILSYRFVQLWKIICDIPFVYMILLAIILFAVVAGLYTATSTPNGTLATGGVLLLLVSLLHLRRSDYSFLFHIEEKPWRVFAVEYCLLAFPVTLFFLIQAQWLVVIGVALGCLLIAFIPQLPRATHTGLTLPRFVPVGLFELRCGFRQNGWMIIVIYAAAVASLPVPFLSLFFLFFYTTIFMEHYRTSESATILCASELKASAFLWRKIRMNVVAYAFTVLPICLLYALLQPEHGWLAAVFFCYGSLNIALMMVTKYAYYRPLMKINAGQIPVLLSLVGMVAFFMLPLTLFFLIKNYVAACRNLTQWLYAYDSESIRSL